MNGLEHPDVVQYAGYLALMFAHFHRHSYTGCKTAVSEVIASQAALVADLNGITRYPHVQENLSHHRNRRTGIRRRANERAPGHEVPQRFLLTCRTRSLPTPAVVSPGKRSITSTSCWPTSPAASAPLPTEESFYDPETADLMAKYVTRNPKYTAEEAHRIFRMMEDKLCDSFSGAQMVAGVHGGGSPVMETITMMT